MKRPSAKEYPSYCQLYVDLVSNPNVLKALDSQIMGFQEFISMIPEEKENYRYAVDKWTIKEVIGHIIDTERIMSYRALRFARKDKTPLPGYDDKMFVENANYNSRNLYNLAHEFALVRESNIALFKYFDDAILDQMGIANDNHFSVRGILFVIVGHAAHHIDIIKSRYLVK